MSLLFVATLAGCASGGDVELLESELRGQEDTISRLQYQLSGTQEDLRVARAETDLLRNQLAERGRPASLLPEQADQLFRVQSVELHKYMTGGLDKDNLHGDEALAVLLVPKDKDGELLKVPGGVHIDLFDMALPPEEQKIGVWDFTPEQMQEMWHTGYFGSGFMLELPWKIAPNSPELTVHAQLATTDGREFHTTSQVRVTPPGSPQIAIKPRPTIQQPQRLIPNEGPLVPPPERDVDEFPGITPSMHQQESQQGVPTSNNWTERTRPTWR